MFKGVPDGTHQETYTDEDGRSNGCRRPGHAHEPPAAAAPSSAALTLHAGQNEGDDAFRVAE